ncbi:hypothetical protein G7075_12825 [Phycicoccus sp. HDW14]|uniref:hypothetical protein n=1 Tax=Phycicoccus sp. HDW14 TaxID=2714941 RepID=UPI0014076903|nr:hypothetical protein [Phycicoccus sp. HDW14]QIM21806.1 hypothetical protein G7075_12825 [Phycicoccus sp. HDW14]
MTSAVPSPSRAPGRRRAPGRVRRLPDGFSSLGASWAVKSAAGLCVVGGAAVALTVPADQAGAESETAAPAADVVATAALVQRSGFESASRSRADRDDAPAPAVAAPRAAPRSSPYPSVSPASRPSRSPSPRRRPTPRRPPPRRVPPPRPARGRARPRPNARTSA